MKNQVRNRVAFGLVAFGIAVSCFSSYALAASSGTTTKNKKPVSRKTAFYPAISTTFKVTGSQGYVPHFTVQDVITGNELKVTITAGEASQMNVYNANQFSNLNSYPSFDYECVRYKVTVLGLTWTTPLLSVSGQGNPLCPSAPKQASHDFSGFLSPGHGPVDVKVEAVATDAYCYGPLAYYGMCALRTVAKIHTVTGSIDLFTNDAEF